MPWLQRCPEHTATGSLAEQYGCALQPQDEEEDVRALARTKARLAAAAPSGEGAEDGPRQEGDGRSFGAAMHQQMQERRKQLGLATER